MAKWVGPWHTDASFPETQSGSSWPRNNNNPLGLLAPIDSEIV